jgi:hypothetical protein
LNNIKDYIVSYYSDKVSNKKPIEDILNNSTQKNIINYNQGIGDAVVLNNLLFKDENTRSDLNIFSPSKHFSDVLYFNKFKDSNHINSDLFFRIEMLEFHNAGSGHLIQKMRRFLNLPVHQKPKSYLTTNKQKVKNKVGIHLTTGSSAFLLNIHKNPRQIYKENIKIINDFIISNPQYSFVEFGGQSVGLENCHNFCGKSIIDSIEELSTCEYFIGLNSSFMNLAACFDIKSIIIINIPIKASDVVLPVLKDITVSDMNWLYPQNIHLHQDDQSELVPRFSLDNLKKAFNGEIYPFWKEDYLDLIF